MTTLGIIAIGRNEGERLRRCLASTVGRGVIVVYVDSASTDGSPALARDLGAEVVDLDMSRPFSASRARNEGFDKLLNVSPSLDYVQFVDGDCEIVPGWLDAARKTLDDNPAVAAVCGRRRERFPEKSIYNRIADIEWNSPVGEVKSVGGDAMFRVRAFQQVGGFDASVVAGEEPELCQRLREANWKILRIDVEMTLHDSAMLHFRQWWKRSVRSGYGSMDVATRFGSKGLFVKQVKSARFWAMGWMAFAILLPIVMIANILVFGHGFSQTFGLIDLLMQTLCLEGLILLLPLVQILRTARGIRHRADSWPDALAYGGFTMIGKWANISGQRQYHRDRAAGAMTRMIDYKNVAKPSSP